MKLNVRIFRDLLVTLGLVGALAAVYCVDRFAPRVRPSDIGETPPSPRREQDFRLAATPAEFDDIGRFFEQLGEGYTCDEITLDALLLPETFDAYDVVFLTSGVAPSWLAEEDLASEDSAIPPAARSPAGQALRRNLRSFVENGGTIYASDWRFDLVSFAFPELVYRVEGGAGASQEVLAEVVDKGLRDAVGGSVVLRFGLGPWFPATLRTDGLKTYLVGTFTTTAGIRVTEPLIVRVPFANGNIVFTAFDTEKLNTEIENELLRYVVLATVTANDCAQAEQKILEGGFSPLKQSLFCTSNDSATASSYTLSEPRYLQFILASGNPRARFRLTVVSPTGEVYSQEGDANVQIDVTNAQKGKWKYDVAALSVPFENFPCSVTMGGKEPDMPAIGAEGSRSRGRDEPVLAGLPQE